MGLHFYENSPYYNKEIFEKADFIWADEIHFKWIDREKAEFAHSFGKPFYAISPELIEESVFNADIKSRWKELIEAGVDAVCTNMPEKFLNQAKERL